VAERIEEDDATIAAGITTAGNFSFSTPNGEVEQIDIVIPNGHANETGIAIVYSGVNVVPKMTGKWVSGNNRRHSFAVEDLPTGAGWSWVGFNNGTLPHTFHVYFHINNLSPDAEPLPPAVLFPIAS
jgi:hypothetical protein